MLKNYAGIMYLTLKGGLCEHVLSAVETREEKW